MYDRYYYPGANKIWEAKAFLVDKELWERFYKHSTEMIITKTGRRIFPTLKVEIKKLEPYKHYCVLLEMELLDRQRMKYTMEGGWVKCGVEESPPPGVYVHPESPSTGEHWMSQVVTFEKCKLTNNNNKPPGSLTLTSMHKYKPKIILVESDSLENLHWKPSITFSFPETEFVAVTAYQNNTITSLKIDHNPFAKGFRENGKSRCKKRKFEEQVREGRPNCISPSQSESSDYFSSSPNHNSPDLSPANKKPCLAVNDSVDNRSENSVANVAQPQQVCVRNQELFRPYDCQFRPMLPNGYWPYGPRLSYEIYRPRVVKNDEPMRNLTDFSIKSILAGD